MSRLLGRFAAWALGLGLGLGAQAIPCAAAEASGPARPHLDLAARLDVAARNVSGRAAYRFTNTAAVPLREVVLWLYPNRLAARGREFSDVSFHWFYPHGFSPGAMVVRAAHAAGVDLEVAVEDSPLGAGTVARVLLPHPVEPGQEIAFDVSFDTTVPERLGSFGCVGRSCRLMGGFYPLLAALGAQGFDLGAPTARVSARASVEAVGAPSLLVNGDLAPAGARSLVTDAADLAAVTVATGLVWQRADRGEAGVDLTFLHNSPRPPPSSDEPLPYVREDRPGLVLDEAARGLRFADRALRALGRPDGGGPGRLVLLEGPLRHRFVEAHGGVVLVSDEIFRIFPVRRLRKFHAFELLRGLLQARLATVLREAEPDGDLDLAADLVASYLLDVYEVGAYRRAETARDLLAPVDFLPAVDQLLHAPLVASSSTYFGDLDERGPLNADVRAIGGWPRGRFLYGKLLDLLGLEGVRAVVGKMVGQGRPLRDAAAEVFGADLAWFFAQWLAPPHKVNYRLEGVRVDKRAGGGEHVVVTVSRQGDPLREPVEVRVTDRDGHQETRVWSEAGARTGSVEVDLPARLARVEIDPRRRLQESPVGALGAADDARFDNARPLPWRFLYNGFGALLNVSSLTANFFAAFTLKRTHDLRDAFGFYALHTEATQIGVGGSYARLFGPQADRNRLASAAFAAGAIDRLDPDFGKALGGTATPGWRVGASVGLQHDDRDYIIDPWYASGAGASVGAALTALDDGQRMAQVSGSLEALRLFELAPAQVLALWMNLGATAGDIRLRSQLLRAGGPGGLRGYGLDELLGRGRAVGRLEFRHRFVSGLSWNLAHFTVVRALGGTAFAEAAVVSSCASLDVGRDDTFYDVGYSFRALHDAFGAYQQLFSIDVAVPLSRRKRTCLGVSNQPDEALGQAPRPPLFVYVTFLPSF